MTPFSQRLDLELERIGWIARNRQWAEEAQQLRRDIRAWASRIDAAINSTREAGVPNKQPAANK